MLTLVTRGVVGKSIEHFKHVLCSYADNERRLQLKGVQLKGFRGFWIWSKNCNIIRYLQGSGTCKHKNI